MGVEEVLDACGEVYDVVSAGPAVLECAEVGFEPMGVCVEEVVVGGCAHGLKDFFDAFEDLGDSSVCEECCEESGDFLIAGGGVVVYEFKGIGVNVVGAVVTLAEGDEMLVKGLAVHFGRVLSRYSC